MSDHVQQIKERLSIVDIVGQYVKLSKAGKNYKGHSPFNKEKTPSFFVSPDKGMYYDFSTGQGGDIFSFIERVEGVDFKGALELLADKAGVTLTKESRQTRDLREKLYAILEIACTFFEKNLTAHTSATTYITERGIQQKTIKNFRIGYARDEWESLYTHLKSVGYTEEEIEKAGLIKKGEHGKYYDRFRSRIIFPIFDSTGRVVAFSGRIHGPAEKNERNAKYLNSPETTLYDKGKILYGFDKAKTAIRKYTFTIFVEGQMDLVLSHQAGYTNTVAVSGTGLTEHHLGLIHKLSKKLVLAFDADRAGIESCGRAATLALKRDIEVKVAHIPEGKDPADCIREDVESWKKIIRDSTHVIEYFLAIAVTKSEKEGWNKRKTITYVRDTVLPYVALIQSATERAYFEHTVAEQLHISDTAVTDDVLTLRNTEAVSVSTVKNTVAAPKTTARFSRKDDLEKTLSGVLFAEDAKENSVLNNRTIQEKAAEYYIPLEKLFARYAEKRDELIELNKHKFEMNTDPLSIINTLMKDLGKIYVDDELEIVRQLQIDAERGNLDESIAALEKRVNKLSQLKKTLE